MAKGGNTRGLHMFVDRMQRDGRDLEYRNRIKEIQRTTDKRYGPARWAAAKEMGYLGVEEEERLYDERCAADMNMQEDAEKLADSDERAFDRAMSKLPPSADPKAELDWIRSHPAMSRKMRSGEKSVIITADDILKCDHGVAPSKAAVHALHHWANNSAEFYKQMIGEHKKKEKSADSGSHEEVVSEEAELSFAKQILADMKDQ